MTLFGVTTFPETAQTSWEELTELFSEFSIESSGSVSNFDTTIQLTTDTTITPESLAAAPFKTEQTYRPLLLSASDDPILQNVNAASSVTVPSFPSISSSIVMMPTRSKLVLLLV
jgi:hypothetical protein